MVDPKPDHRLAPLLLLTVAACSTAEADQPERAFEEETISVETPSVSEEPDEPTRRMAFASSAFIHRVDAAITPWCAAVLVAPDVAVTALGCVAGVEEHHLSVGVGAPGEANLHQVEAVKVLDADPRLAALRLETPLEDVEPATLGAPATSRRCDAFGTSWLYVLSGDPSKRWTWSACVEPAPLGAIARVEDGHSDGQIGNPNCHGDYGAGVYSSDEELLGVVVSVASTDGCAVGFQLVSPKADERDAFDEALELGR